MALSRVKLEVGRQHYVLMDHHHSGGALSVLPPMLSHSTSCWDQCTFLIQQVSTQAHGLPSLRLVIADLLLTLSHDVLNTLSTYIIL